MSSILQTLAEQPPFGGVPSQRETATSPRVQVAAYLRVSTDLQAENHSLETQENRVREKLDSHYGPHAYDLTIYKDDGLSGGYGPIASGIQQRTRPTLKKLGEAILEGRYACLAVYSSSRLFRSARWFLQFLEDVIIPSGIEFLSATENLDITSAQGRSFAGMLAIFNATYREDCQQRARDASASRTEQGYTIGIPGYGWSLEARGDQDLKGKRRRGIVRDPQAGPHLLFMRDRYLAGAGCTKIAGELNERGVPTPKGVKWSNDQVIRILKNPIHAGLVHTKRFGVIEGQHFEHRYWEKQTHQEILDLAQKRRTHLKTQTGKTNLSYIVSGIAFCARCGKRLYPTGGKYRGYFCRNGRNQGKPTCREVTAHVNMLEGAVVEEILRVAQDPQMQLLLLQEAGRVTTQEDEALHAEHDQLRQTLENVGEQTSRLLDFLGRDVIAEAEFLCANSQLQRRRSEIEQRIEEIKTTLANRAQREAWAARIEKVVLNFPLLWDNASFDEQRHLLLTLVESLTVDRHEREALIRVKLHLMPEREVRISFDSSCRFKVKPKGVAALTPRHLAVLHYIGQNKTPAEIAGELGTGVNNIYHFTVAIRRLLGVRCMQEAYNMARSLIDQQLPFLPLGSSGRGYLRLRPVPVLPDSLQDVLPLLSQGATCREIARRTGLTPDAVLGRRKRILEVFGAKTIFEATERAKALGLLPP